MEVNLNMRDFVRACQNSEKKAVIENLALQRVLNRALESRVDELRTANELLQRTLETVQEENKFLKEDYVVLMAEFGQFKAEHGLMPNEDDLI